MCSDTNCWGYPTGGVLIFAQKEGKHTETQYLTWFGKTAYIYGRESILFRDRERITTQYMEKEDHFTHTQLPALLLHLQLLQWQQGCCHCSSSLSLYSLHILTTLILFALTKSCLFIGIHDIFSTMATHGLIHLSMVGATTIDK